MILEHFGSFLRSLQWYDPVLSLSLSNTQYTPPTPTRRNCFVASRRRRRCVHEFATSSRRLPTDSIHNLETGQTDCVCVCFCVCLTTWIFIDTDNFINSDDIMTSLLKKLLIFIKIGVIKRYGVCLVSLKITVDRIRRQSSSASCELCSHRRRDKTVSSRRRCVLGLKVLCRKARLRENWVYHEVEIRILLSRGNLYDNCVLSAFNSW